MAKSFMVIGAGFGQLPAIRTARSMGLRVVALDRNPDALGMREADVPLVVDVTDHEGAIRAARTHGVAGVMTMQSDLPVPTVGAVVDALGLPGVGLAVGARCSNKIEARQRFAEAGVPQPPFGIAGDPETAARVAAEVGFPVSSRRRTARGAAASPGWTVPTGSTQPSPRPGAGPGMGGSSSRAMSKGSRSGPRASPSTDAASGSGSMTTWSPRRRT